MLKNFAIGTMTALALTFVAPTTAPQRRPRTSSTRRSPPDRSRRSRRRSQPPTWSPRSRARARSPCSRRPTRRSRSCRPARSRSLLKPENKAKLQRILTYHVVAGKVMAADVMKMSSAKAVSGDTLTIAAHDGGVMADNARVVKTDIAASNGVIHVIDTVMMPKDN